MKRALKALIKLAMDAQMSDVEIAAILKEAWDEHDKRRNLFFYATSDK